jgi:protein-S-isoprenylcysteine O-methyltransferase Ste14
VTAAVAIDAGLDAALLLAFAVPHSLLISRPGAALVARAVPRELFWTVYGLHASLALLVTYALWRPLPGVVWSVAGAGGAALLAAHAAGWALMGWTLAHEGPLRQAGLAQWWAHVRGTPPPGRARPNGGPFRYVRHPIYVSMLAMIWFTPHMTAGHLLLSIVWSGYLAVGVLHKEARLARAR